MLTLLIGIRVSPEPGAVELLERYMIALSYAINRILSQDLKTIKEVHRELKEWFGFPSRIAHYCYRDSVANAEAWGGTLIRVGGLPCCCARDQA